MAVFDASFFGMGMGHSGGCVAAAIEGTTCPTDIMGFAVRHASALQTLLTAVPPRSGRGLITRIADPCFRWDISTLQRFATFKTETFDPMSEGSIFQLFM